MRTRPVGTSNTSLQAWASPGRDELPTASPPVTRRDVKLRFLVGNGRLLALRYVEGDAATAQRRL